MNAVMKRLSGLTRIVVALVLLALLVAVVVVFGMRDDKQYVTVDFAATNSVYKGSDVRVLGVPVGRVESLTPRGEVVRAKLSYTGDVKLPADVKAVVVSPSLVGDRFIQLAPAYTGGPQLKDGAYVPKSRTAVPVELDEVYRSLDDLSVALGPKGANKNGSLSDLIDASAQQLDGEGQQVNETIRNFGKLSQTLSNNKDDLFGSVREVQEFVAMLKKNDTAVRDFNDSTAEVAQVLAGERKDLAATVKALAAALVDVRGFVKENRSALTDDVDDLTSISRVLVKNRDQLEQIVNDAPTALSNVALTYNGKYGTLDNRMNLDKLLFGNLKDPASFVCMLLGETGTKDGEVCKTLGDLLDTLGVDDLTGALPLPRTAAGSGATGSPQVAATRPDQVNDSLEDMLGVAR